MKIYLIKAQEIYLYKIGITKNIKRRLKQLQTGCPFQLEIVAFYEPSNFVTKIEKILHRSFACYQKSPDFYELQGEWFDLPNNIASEFLKICQENENNLLFLQEQKNPFIK
jgi:hypothetical protein